MAGKGSSFLDKRRFALLECLEHSSADTSHIRVMLDLRKGTQIYRYINWALQSGLVRTIEKRGEKGSRGRPFKVFELTDTGRKELLRCREARRALEMQTKTVSTLAKDLRQMPAEDVSEFCKDLGKEFEYWFNRIDEGEAYGATSFHTKFPVLTPRYRGWITIQWMLTPEERERRERERQKSIRKENVEMPVVEEEIAHEEHPNQDDNQPSFVTYDQKEDVREKLYGYRRDEKGRIMKRRRVQFGEGG